jgi:hypothetical protein
MLTGGFSRFVEAKILALRDALEHLSSEAMDFYGF